MKILCHSCGAELDRSPNIRKATCVDCRLERKREWNRTHPSPQTRQKELPSLEEWARASREYLKEHPQEPLDRFKRGVRHG